MGSTASGIPTRAPVATSPFEILAFSILGSVRMMPKMWIEMER